MSTALFSMTVKGRGRSYFIDIYQAVTGSNFLSINESKKTYDGKFMKNRVIIFEDSLDDVVSAINAAYDEMKKGGV